MMRRFAWQVCLLLAVIAPAVSAQTRAWLDRPEITYGETVALNISTDQDVAEIDYAPLRAQFDLGGQSVRRSFELVNGRARRTSLFSVGLRPRAPGLVSIPALRVGTASTAPLRLVVLEPAVRPASADADVFVEMAVDARQPYVQQAVGVTVRLHYAIPLLSGQLDLDSPPTASLQRVGEDITYQRLLGGRVYSVVERRFLLVPERSGPLVLPGARLNGVAGSGYGGPMFGDDRRPVSAAAPAVRLDVRPIPAAAPQPWLPLRGLSLRYLKAPRQAFAGQAAEVEIELVADGATAAQVPAITLPDVSGVQAFADPPQVEEQFVEGRPRTVVRRRIALVPIRPGTSVIPGPRMAWWDAVAGAPRTAMLPPLRLQVAPAAGSVPAAKPGPSVPARAHTPVAPARAPSPPVALDLRWVWGGLVLAAIAAVITVLVVVRQRRVRGAASGASGARGATASAALPLAVALRGDDLGLIAQALVAEADVDLDGLCRVLDDPAQVAAVRALQAARWGDGDPQAAVRQLRTAFAGGLRRKRAGEDAASLLPPLYPQR